MAALVLPSSPRPARMVPRPISARGEMRPASSGPVTRVVRPGTRTAWDVEMPAIRYADSLAWDDLLSESDTVVMDILQPGLDTGEPGSPRVNGAGQSGMSLILDGLTPGYVIRKGQWLSVPVGGQLYAYKSRAAVTVAGGGTVTVPLRTMLRRSPANNAVVAIAQPQAEGYPTIDPDSLAIGVDGLVRLRFILEERD